MKISQAVIPAAGLGTRFLPYTRAIPKEMLPLLDRPALDYSIRELYSAQITDIALIINERKLSILDYFSKREASPQTPHNTIDDILQKILLTYIYQDKPRGLGHAILTARSFVRQGYCAVVLPDDLIISLQPTIGQLSVIAERERATVIAVQEVPKDMVTSYGIIGYKKQLSASLIEVSTIIEKPAIGQAPSRLAVIGRYILSPSIFTKLAYREQLVRGELSLTEAIQDLIDDGERVVAYVVEGVRHDLGNPCGWIKAIIDLALAHPIYGGEIKSFLADRILMEGSSFSDQHQL
jgi:UTP--glucose-1-phosphate uridylyltransferase